MTIGDYIKRYRQLNSLTQRDFASKAGVSQTYIQMLEAGHHPRSGKPITPAISKMAALASAMDIPLSDFINAIDENTIINIDSDKAPLSLSPTEQQLVVRFRLMSKGERNMLLRSVGLPEEKGDSQGATG